MTRSERQQLIERYSSGAMSLREQREFRASLAGDAELRRLLRADEAIASAAGAERASFTAGNSAPGEHLASLLVASRMSTATAVGMGLGTKLLLIAAAAGLALLAVIAYLPLQFGGESSLGVGSRIPVTRDAPNMAAPEAPSTEAPAATQSGTDVTAAPERRHLQPSTRASKRDASGEAVRPPGDARSVDAAASTEASAPPKEEMEELPEFEETEVEVPVIAR